MPPRYLVCSCPRWPLTATGRALDAPLAVLEGGRVVACSVSARRNGVREGQRRKEAESNCPELVVLPRDLPGEVRAFARVVGALESFGVAVALRSPGWAGFATLGPTRRLGGEAALAAAVGAAVGAVLAAAPFSPVRAADEGPQFRIGIADGPFAATLAARVGRIIPPGESAAFLSGHPLEDLGRPGLTEVLGRLGIRTLGQFAALDAADVLARFGRDGAHAHGLARGGAGAVLATRPATVGYEVEERFDEPLLDVAAAAFAARSLAEGLCGALEEDGRGCAIVVVEAETSRGELRSRRWSHDGPWSASLVVERLRWQLDEWLSGPRSTPSAEGESGPPQGIVRLSLRAEEVAPLGGRQTGLFGQPPGTDERAERVFARVQGMLGLEGVLRPVLVGGRGPAERVRLVPFGEAGPAEARAASRPWPGQLPAPNPATVFACPLPAELVGADGEVVRVDGHGVAVGEPARLLVQGRTHEVRAWSVPWPVHEQWWRRGGRRRARLQVVTADGSGWLLVVERGAWAVEGRYD